MSDSFEFEIDESFLLPVNATSDTCPPVTGKCRKYDPTLFHRGRATAARLKEQFRAILALEISKDPEAFKEFNVSLEVEARAKSTPGAYKVLLSLIDIILGPRGATLTQEGCRATVQAMHPEMAVAKDWTKPLPAWVFARTKSKAQSMYSASPVVVKKGMSLRDLHNAVRIASAKAGDKARAYSARVTIAVDAIFINDARFKVSVNKSNGREYAIVRLNIDALETALKS